MLFPAKSDELVSNGLTSAAMTTPGAESMQDRAYFGYGGVSPRDNDENDEENAGGKKKNGDGKKKKKGTNGLTSAAMKK